MDWKTFGSDIVAAVKDYVGRTVEPLSARLDALDQKAAEIASTVAAIPEGRPGSDGVGFDDLAVDYDGERTVTLRFERGDVVKEFPLVLPVVLDRGVYSTSQGYQKGDGVTYAGSFWIATEDTSERPENGKGWRLSVKRGRDGKRASE